MSDSNQHEFKQFKNTSHKQNCCKCKVELKQNQFKLKTYDIGCQCYKSICICCCLEKARQHQIDTKPVTLECCKRQIPTFIKTFYSLIKQICTICGKNCSSPKVKLGKGDPYFHVEVSCYAKLKSKYSISLTKLQDKILKDIKQYCYKKCNFCEYGAFNIIKAEINSINIWKDEKQLAYFKIIKQLQICKKCYEKQLKKQKIREEIVFNKCATCHQMQIYEQLPNSFGFGAQKQFNLVQYPKQWPLPYSDPSKVWRCSTCIYNTYQQTQIDNSKFKIDTKLFNLVKIQYQEHFKVYCMGCSIKASSTKIHLIQSSHTYGICSFVCARCYEQYSKRIYKYKGSLKLKYFLDLSKKNNHNSGTIIYKSHLELKAEKLIEIFKKQAKGLQQLIGNAKNHKQNKLETPQDEFSDCSVDYNRYSKKNWSMINNIDQQQELSKRRIDQVFYHNSQKQQIAKPSSCQQQKVKNGAQMPINKFQDKDKSVTSGKIYQLEDTILEVELKKFEFNSQPNDKSCLNLFDIISWQKKVIHKFNEQVHKTAQKQVFKPVSEQIWATRSIINKDQNICPRQRCLMYNQCKKEHESLNIYSLCNMCFVKYLVGEKRIIEVLETKKLAGVKESKPEFKPSANQEPQPKGKEQSSFFKGMLN